MGEAVALAATGVMLGVALLYLGLLVGRTIMQTRLGLSLPIGLPTAYEWLLLAVMMASSFIAGLWPAIRAYRYSLSDGMTVHV